MRAFTAVAVLSAAAVAAAQDAQNFTIDFTKVGLSLRAQWCQAEQNTCTTLCAKTEKQNDCDPNTLAYSCLCSNNSAPGLQYYTGTIYTFTCEEAFSECITANVGSANGQANCTSTIKNKCGTLDPNKAVVGGGSSGSSSTTAGPSSTTSGAGTSSTSTSRNAAPTIIGNGIAAVAAGVFAAALL